MLQFFFSFFPSSPGWGNISGMAGHNSGMLICINAALFATRTRGKAKQREPFARHTWLEVAPFWFGEHLAMNFPRLLSDCEESTRTGGAPAWHPAAISLSSPIQGPNREKKNRSETRLCFYFYCDAIERNNLHLAPHFPLGIDVPPLLFIRPACNAAAYCYSKCWLALR